jgi:hypothetical protein
MIAAPSDIPAIVEQAKSQTQRFPYLRPDNERIYGLARLAVTSNQHFACINDSGCLVAMSDNHLWAEKKMAQVVLWTGGFELVREYRDWLEGRPAIRIGCIDFSFDYDPRIGFGLERIGFKKHGDMYIWRK